MFGFLILLILFQIYLLLVLQLYGSANLKHEVAGVSLEHINYML